MTTAMAETHEFKTEIKELLHLIIHTLYTHKEIFLRELLSNAADALSKVQFEGLTNKDLYDKDQKLEINLKIDKDAKTLTVEDTGIGMSRDELIAQIGTIAHSGTKKFMKELTSAESKKKSLPELIGQFGVGFYSVFMVADKVTIETKSHVADEPAVSWESDGGGAYILGASERRKRGTAITLHLKEDESEFLEKHRIKNLVRRYSNYLPFPVTMDEDAVNEPEALWRRSKRSIKDTDYNEFYKQVGGDWQDPMLHQHYSADAPVQFNAVVFVPQRAPHEFQGQSEEHGLKLYVKRVWIQDDCKQLIPKWLRFLKGVVESEDLPLNVSRESIQSDLNITKINKVLTKKFLEYLNKLAGKDEETYLKFWEQFGRYIKEGIYSDPGYRDKLQPLLRFHSTKQADKATVTLKSYFDGKVEDQKAIYYAVGQNRDQLRRSPHMELFLKNDIEVLLMVEPMDDMVLNTLADYEGLKFVNVESGDLQLPENLKKEVSEVEVDESLTKLKDKVREVLQDKVKEVRFSRAFTDSPCKFFNADGGMSHGVRKLMYGMDGLSGFPLKRDLELNPDHAFIKALAGRIDNASINDQINLLFHMANLLEGSVEEPQELAALILPLLR